MRIVWDFSFWGWLGGFWGGGIFNFSNLSIYGTLLGVIVIYGFYFNWSFLFLLLIFVGVSR